MHTVELEVVGGKPVGGAQAVRLVRGEQVSLNVHADRDDELHLHGYDLHLSLKAGQAATLSFAAQRTGRFAAELHQSGQELVVFEIYPR